MAKQYCRTARGYDGIEPTSRSVVDLLPSILRKAGLGHKDKTDLILSSWPDVIGERLSSMTKAISFDNGILTISVNNSTLHSLLVQTYRPQLVKSLRERFPGVDIRNIVFRIG